MGSVCPTDLMEPSSDKSCRVPSLSGNTEAVLNESWKKQRRKIGVITVVMISDSCLRLISTLLLAASLACMLTSDQHSSVQLLGFTIPVSMTWKKSQPFQYLVVADALACGYMVLQFTYQCLLLCTKLDQTKSRMWLKLLLDQVSVYLILSAGAAAAGASRTNRVGLQKNLEMHNIHVPTVCSVLHSFCDHVSLAILFTLIASGTSLASAILSGYSVVFIM